jgi:hypothetical protein
MFGENREEMAVTVNAVTRVIGAGQAVEGLNAVSLQGQYRGRKVDAKIGQFRRGTHGSGGVYVHWRVFGPTFGVMLDCSPPAVFDDGKNFTGNPPFDARYSVNGAPRDVLRHLITPGVQAHMLALGTQLRFAADCVECVASDGHDDVRAQAVLGFAEYMLQLLPHAVRAGGAEPFVLAHGTLASHPEVAPKLRSNAVAVVVVLVLVVAIPVIGMLVAIVFFLLH